MRYGFLVPLTKSNLIAPGLIYLAKVDSTNLELARRNSESPLSDRTVLAAALQTDGVGRMGREWVSEPDTSLSVSILLRPKHKKIASWATLVAAVSVRHAIDFLTDLKPLIKWPNDVLFEDKKLCGILAQLQSDGSIVLGVGVNLRHQRGAPETATSISDLGHDVDFDSMLAAFLTAFFTRWGMLEDLTELSIEKTRNELIEHSATIGSKVRAELPGGEEIVGIAVDIDSNGQLVINAPEPRVLAAADVWHLRK